jgi:hypothetical protein
MSRNHVSSNVARSGGFVNVIVCVVLAAVIGFGYVDVVTRALGA